MLLTMEEPFVKIIASEPMREYVLSVHAMLTNNNKDDIPENIQTFVKKENNLLLESDVKWLYSKLDRDKKCKMYKILEGCDILLPEPKYIPRNPQLEARCQKLKLLAAEKDYQHMTRNVDTARVRQPDDSIAMQMAEMNRQIIAVFQLIVTVSTGFMFGFYGLPLIYGNIDLAGRILLGVFSAIIVGIADLYFLLKKLNSYFDNGKSADPPKVSKTNKSHEHND